MSALWPTERSQPSALQSRACACIDIYSLVDDEVPLVCTDEEEEVVERADALVAPQSRACVCIDHTLPRRETAAE